MNHPKGEARINKIRLRGEQSALGESEPAVRISISLCFSDNAPPALVQAIGTAIAKISLEWQGEEMLCEIVEEVQAIADREKSDAEKPAKA